jgi:sugar O-acyltransferase (sialic acid O-acetyltransferase NeuD family)
MKEIVIFGAGGLGKEVLELINQINGVRPVWNVVGFFDDSVIPGTTVNGISVLGGFESLQNSNFTNVVIAVGSPEARANFIGMLIEKKTMPNLIHPTVSFPKDNISIGYGTIIAANVFLSVNVKMGNGILLNVGCSIGHDVVIGNFCTINPGCRISGSVRLGDCVFAGVGSILNNNISIVNNVKIGAGAVVLKSVEKKSTVFGNPARVVLE